MVIPTWLLMSFAYSFYIYSHRVNKKNTLKHASFPGFTDRLVIDLSQ